jgi:hypothetical protein
VIVVNTLHVVTQVPLAGESISRNGSLTTLINTKERLVAMTMESVGLTFVAEEASSRGEAGALARLSLAAVGLQVRVHEFAGSVSIRHLINSIYDFLLIVALELLGSVVAAWLSFPWAVVKSILKWSGLLVEVMVPSGFTIAVLSSWTSKSRGRSRKLVECGNGLSIDIFRDQRNVPVKAKTVDLVRNWIGGHYVVGHYVPW